MKNRLLPLSALALILALAPAAEAQTAPAAKKKTTRKATTATKKKVTRPAVAGKPAAQPRPAGVAAAPAPAAPQPAPAPAPEAVSPEARQAQINAFLQNLETYATAKEQLEENHAGGTEDIYYNAGVAALTPQVAVVTTALNDPLMSAAMTPAQRERYQQALTRYAATK